MSGFIDVTGEERKEEVVQVYSKPKYDWRYENSISFTKTNEEIGSMAEHKYSVWRTNNYFSNFADTVLYANEMNINYGITDKMHYDYLKSIIAKKRRFFKHDKKSEKKDTTIELLQEYYGYSHEKAKAAAPLLTDEHIDIMKKRLYKGTV